MGALTRRARDLLAGCLAGHPHLGESHRLSAVVSVVAAGVLLLAGCSNSVGGSGFAEGKGPTPKADPPPVAKVSMDPADGAKDINPKAPVKVTVAEGTIDDVTLSNPEGKKVGGKLAEDKRSWAVTEALGFGKTYTWAGNATGTDGKKVRIIGSFATQQGGKLVRATINPTDNATVGVGMPIKIEFDSPVEDKAAVEKVLKVETPAPVEGAWAWLNNREVHYRPKTYWPGNTKVKVSAPLYAVPLGGGAFGKADLTTAFTIGRNQVIKINTPAHRLVVTRDGAQVASYPASFGQDNDPNLATPNGTMIIMAKEPVGDFSNPRYGYTNVLKKWSMRISNHGEYLHENNDNAANIGKRNTSHGCANLLEADAKALFDSSLIGDPVEISGSISNMPTTSDVFDWLIPWNQWLAKSALR